MRSRWVLVKCRAWDGNGSGCGDGSTDGDGLGDGTSGWGHHGDGGDNEAQDRTPYVTYNAREGYEFVSKTEASE